MTLFTDIFKKMKHVNFRSRRRSARRTSGRRSWRRWMTSASRWNNNSSSWSSGPSTSPASVISRLMIRSVKVGWSLSCSLYSQSMSVPCFCHRLLFDDWPVAVFLCVCIGLHLPVSLICLAMCLTLCPSNPIHPNSRLIVAVQNPKMGTCAPGVEYAWV